MFLFSSEFVPFPRVLVGAKMAKGGIVFLQDHAATNGKSQDFWSKHKYQNIIAPTFNLIKTPSLLQLTGFKMTGLMFSASCSPLAGLTGV